MRTIAQVIVGSQLHGLATPKSDTDYVNVVTSPVELLFSPFYTDKALVQEDNVSRFELRHLLYLCTKGNPTALEVLWSTKISFAEPSWYKVLANRQKLLTKRAVFEAHKGYSLSQKKLKDGDNPTRQIKARIAEFRILRQGTELLRTSTFNPEQVKYKDVLNSYKLGDRSLEPHIDELIHNQAIEMEESYNESTLSEKLDRKWFDAWLFSVYTKET